MDTIDHAMQISKKYQYRVRIVTLEGELFHPGGSLSGGTFKNNSNLLGRRKEQEALEKENIETRPVWKPMHMQPVFAKCDFIKVADKAVSEDLFTRGVCLPSDTKMTEEEQNRVIKTIIDLWK